MVELNTTDARLIDANWASRVPSPAYDAMTPSQRRQMRHANPWSFLNVTLSPEDMAESEQVSNQQLLLLARESLDRIMASGAFAKTSAPCLYAYRLRSEYHTQTGIVGDILITDYENGLVKIHEQVRQHRAELLAEHLYQLGVSSSPIALTYQNNPTISSLIGDCTNAQAALTIPSDQGIEQTIWRITDTQLISRIQTAFSSQSLYIIDGHHRAAASLAASKRSSSPTAKHMFAALFPHDALQLLGFNRWIKRHVRYCSQSTFERFSRLNNCREITPDTKNLVAQKNHVLVYINKRWFDVDLPGNEFDVQKLFDQLLRPCFNLISSDDPRIINTPGDQPAQKLMQMVDDAGEAGFIMAPLQMDEFLQAADNGVPLPPKSTYFTPKVQSGVFLRRLRRHR